LILPIKAKTSQCVRKLHRKRILFPRTVHAGIDGKENAGKRRAKGGDGAANAEDEPDDTGD
jgi:hypothetical protein